MSSQEYTKNICADIINEFQVAKQKNKKLRQNSAIENLETSLRNPVLEDSCLRRFSLLYYDSTSSLHVKMTVKILLRFLSASQRQLRVVVVMNGDSN